MPDWSYQTFCKPILFALPARVARDLALNIMGGIARVPGGSRVIDFLGHMAPDVRLETIVAGERFASPVGLGGRLDPDAVATCAIARFGFGVVEMGPISLHPQQVTSLVERGEGESIRFGDLSANRGLAYLALRVEYAARKGVAILARVRTDAAEPEQATFECRQLVERLAPSAKIFSIDTLQTAIGNRWTEDQWRLFCREIKAASTNVPLVLCLSIDQMRPGALAVILVAMEEGFAGVHVCGEMTSGREGMLIGKPARQQTLALVAQLREDLPTGAVLIAGGGVHEPADAVRLQAAGANVVLIDSGLVYSGPGLAKRVNDALLWTKRGDEVACASVPTRAVELDWFWALLMGLGMFVGGLLALIIAATRVVLPYDEDFVCMSRAQLELLNGRLLSFMSHDRISLAGTMLAVAVIYLCLSAFGMRRGMHWARVSVLASAFVGFGTFFLFLGFGYFDPFHAFVTAILFQFLLLAIHCRSAAAELSRLPNLLNDAAWRRSQWGQLLLIAHAVALVVAGAVISSIGATSVFVPEDLEFMQTTPEVLTAANPKIVPLIAHDRASFGGMILASGVAALLPSLWGFRQGNRWLWWMFATSGLVAYVPAITVHYCVDYVNTWHLTPAYSGLAVLGVGLLLARGYLCRDEWEAEQEWQAVRAVSSDGSE